MYVKLKDVCFWFEDRYSSEDAYFNLVTYEFLTDSERLNLIHEEVYSPEEFLSVERLHYSEIGMRYLQLYNEKNLLRKTQKDPYNRDFLRDLHNFVVGCRLEHEWLKFEEDALIQFGREWCEKNQIKCSCK